MQLLLSLKANWLLSLKLETFKGCSTPSEDSLCTSDGIFFTCGFRCCTGKAGSCFRNLYKEHLGVHITNVCLPLLFPAPISS